VDNNNNQNNQNREDYEINSLNSTQGNIARVQPNYGKIAKDNRLTKLNVCGVAKNNFILHIID